MLRAELLPAPRLLPQLGRLDDGHQQLERAGAVHLLADDLLDLAQREQAERHPGVDAAASLIMPARSISWWLTISASAGASFNVEMQESRYAHGRFLEKTRILAERRRASEGLATLAVLRELPLTPSCGDSKRGASILLASSDQTRAARVDGDAAGTVRC